MVTATWKTVRVFISSTFRDMQAERDWLARFVFPRLREELVKYRVHFVDVDLRWGVTSDQNALGVCREVIDECHPRFMCMLGGRYGWVPDGQDKSITADEIHYGVLGRDAAKRGHAFFYFRDDNATARMVEETLGDFREPDGSTNATKLANLKKAITAAGLNPRIYGEDAQWDAAQKRLTGLEAFGNQVRTDLLNSLKDDPELAARFTSEGGAQPDEFAEEAEQMEAFIEERTDHYVVGSRDSLLREMIAFATADGAPNIFVLTGDPGSGKSAFLAKFTREVAALHHSQVVIPHFIGASTGSTDLRRTLRRLSHELAKAAENTEPLPLDIKELITHFQKLLAEAGTKMCIVLVLDALNQFDATDGAHWLNWLPHELPPGVRIVASVIAPAEGQPEHQTLAILRHRPGTRMEKLEPLTEADTLAIIEGSLRRYAKRLSPEQLAALLAKPAGRLPLYILTALEELRTLGTYEEITERIRTLPSDARALFGWILTKRLAHDPGFRDREGRLCGEALVEKFAACLGVSRHGLSPAELTALLDPGDPLGNVAALLRLLRPYLMRRGELLDFYHGQFREAAEVFVGAESEASRQAREELVRYFSGLDARNPRKLDELLWHLRKLKRWAAIREALSNVHFLQALMERDENLMFETAAALDNAEPGNLPSLFAFVLRDVGAYIWLAGTHRAVAHFLTGLGTMFRRLGYAQEAFSLFDGVWTHFSQLGVEVIYGAILSECGLFVDRQREGDLQAAWNLAATLEAMASDEQSGIRFQALAVQVTILLATRQVDEALPIVAKMRALAELCDNKSMMAFALGSEAKARSLTGALDEARDLHSREEQLYRALDDKDALQVCIGNQATVVGEMGEFEKSLRILTEQEHLCREIGKMTSLANCLSNKAFVYARMGNKELARKLLKEQEEIARRIGSDWLLRNSMEAQKALDAS